MNYINTLISEELIYALGWTMVHSLWQSILVALVLAFLMLGLQKRSAKVRYLAAYISLTAVLMLAVLTFSDLYEYASHSTLQEITLLVNVNSIVLGSEESSFFQILSQQFVYYFNEHLPLLVTTWLVGMAFFLLRFLGGLAYIQHLRHHRNHPLPLSWQNKLDDLAKKIQLKIPIKLLESSLVKAPLAIGYLKPIILLPIGAINNLSAAQVEAILAHELAHIYRKDYLLNIVQSLIEILFYYNPAVWWISANIRTERENCCDDLAIDLCGSSLTYAKALVSLQEIEQVRPGLAMSFSNNKNQLLNRIQRILNQPQNKSNIMEKFTATCMLLVIILIFSISANSPVKKDEDKNPKEITIVEEAKKTNNPNVFVEIFPEKVLAIDTLPKGKTRLKVNRGGEKVEAKIKDGKITYLKIDEKEVPKEKLDDYEDYVEEIIERIPEPIAPIAPSSPPTPFRPIDPIAPPAPSPPTPPIYYNYRIKSPKKIQTQRDEDGNALIIIESLKGDEIVELKVDKDGDVFLDDDEIKLDDDETVFFLDDNTPFVFRSNSFDWRNEDHKELMKDYKEYLEDHNINFRGWDEAFYLNSGLIEKLQDRVLKLNDYNLEKQEDLLANLQEKLQGQKDRIHAYSLDALSQLKHLKHLDNLNALQNLNGSNYAFGYFNNIGVINNEVQAALEQEMLNSGLVEDISSYKLTISGKSLKINGKRQSSAIHKRFMDVYEGVSGIKLSKNSKIVISKDGED